MTRALGESGKTQCLGLVRIKVLRNAALSKDYGQFSVTPCDQFGIFIRSREAIEIYASDTDNVHIEFEPSQNSLRTPVIWIPGNCIHVEASGIYILDFKGGTRVAHALLSSNKARVQKPANVSAMIGVLHVAR